MGRVNCTHFFNNIINIIYKPIVSGQIVFNISFYIHFLFFTYFPMKKSPSYMLARNALMLN